MVKLFSFLFNQINKLLKLYGIKLIFTNKKLFEIHPVTVLKILRQYPKCLFTFYSVLKSLFNRF